MSDTSDNILELYMYATGISNIPKTWHKWTCLSMVAAALGDRVWMGDFAWKPLFPNLYVMLIGPSGVGKGAVIDFGLQMGQDRMNISYGSSTYKAIFDRMSGNTPDYPDPVHPAKLYLIHDELAQAVGSGLMAKELIKAMTAWYGNISSKNEDNTRMHGSKKIEDVMCVNWLAGSTVEWLIEAVSIKDMMSGFFGRICTVPGAYDYSNRIYEAQVPQDYEQVIHYLNERFYEMTYYEGRFEMLPAAKEIDRDWFENRPKPEKMIEPFWMRCPTLAHKLAMVLSACDGMDLTIHPKHISRAHKLIDEIEKYMKIVTANSMQLESDGFTEALFAAIKERKNGLFRRDALKLARKYGKPAKELDNALNVLINIGDVTVRKSTHTLAYLATEDPIIVWKDF